jgi:hypothetical protein
VLLGGGLADDGLGHAGRCFPFGLVLSEWLWKRLPPVCLLFRFGRVFYEHHWKNRCHLIDQFMGADARCARHGGLFRILLRRWHAHWDGFTGADARGARHGGMLPFLVRAYFLRVFLKTVITEYTLLLVRAGFLRVPLETVII